MLMAKKVPLPAGHPSMDPYVCKINKYFTAGALCGYATAGFFFIAVAIRFIAKYRKWRKSKGLTDLTASSRLEEKDSEVPIGKPPLPLTPVVQGTALEAGGPSELLMSRSAMLKSQPLPVPRRDQRLSRSIQHMRRSSVKQDIYQNDGYESLVQGLGGRKLPQGAVTVDSGQALKAKSTSLAERIKHICLCIRIPKTDYQSGDVLLFLGYLGLNILCAYWSQDPNLGRGMGSLAAYNAMVLVLPATRNSVLTWLLGFPFDHVVVYHRFFGRFTMLCALIHFIFYMRQFFSGAYVEWVYLSGFFAFVRNFFF